MNNICRIFTERSNYIFKWLTKQPEVKEESLTDHLLFTISEELANVKYKQFSRHEEGKTTGADWEWWILFPDNEAFCMRIQAKKLKNRKDNYAGIAYTRNDSLQIERLLEDCRIESFAPFYVFYSSELSPETLCQQNKNSEGVFLSEANMLKSVVIDNARAKYLAKDLLKHATPISCLFCCPLSSDLSYQGFKNHLENYFPTLSTVYNDNPQGFVKTPPRILQLLDTNADSWWESEYGRYVEDVDAIVVFDLRNE